MIRFDITLDESSIEREATIVARHVNDSRPFIPPIFENAGDTPGEDEEETTEPETIDATAAVEEILALSEPAVWAAGVIITVKNVLWGYDALPYCYEIVQPGEASTSGMPPFIGTAIIRIVAAPGVHVRILPVLPYSPMVRVDVIRVQDPRCIPELGEPIDASLLLSSNGVEMRTYLSERQATPFANLRDRMTMARSTIVRSPEDPPVIRDVASQGRVVAIPQRNGMLFYDNLTERMLRVRVQTSSRRGVVGSTNHRARFGYLIHQDSSIEQPAVIVIATGAPAVEVEQFPFGRTLPPSPLVAPVPAIQQTRWAEMDSREPFILYRSWDFSRVPMPGDALEFGSMVWQQISYQWGIVGIDEPTHPRFDVLNSEAIPLVEVPPELETMLSRMATDVLIGRIPYVGDAVDLIELGYAFISGRDRWGQHLSLIELTLMSLGAVLPFVSNRDVRLLGEIVLGGQLVYAGGTLAASYMMSDTVQEPEWGPE